MQTSYSIAEARNQFTSVVRAAEGQSDPIQIMRHGKPVVVMLSMAEYERLIAKPPQRDFWTAYQEWREKWNVDEEGDVDVEDIWGDVRDKTPAPEAGIWD